MKTIRVLLVDDQHNVRLGLAMRLRLEPDMEVVGEAGDGSEVVEAVARSNPDVVLMDYQMPVVDGIDATRALAESGSRASVIMLTMNDSAALRREAEAAGVSAFICKNEPCDILMAAIRDAAGRSEPAGRA